MSDSSIILFPGMIKPLGLARVYGHLVQRSEGVYHPGGSHPACTTSLARRMVKGGWLVMCGDRRELPSKVCGRPNEPQFGRERHLDAGAFTQKRPQLLKALGAFAPGAASPGRIRSRVPD
jgi:hypothetical protein